MTGTDPLIKAGGDMAAELRSILHGGNFSEDELGHLIDAWEAAAPADDTRQVRIGNDLSLRILEVLRLTPLWTLLHTKFRDELIESGVNPDKWSDEGARGHADISYVAFLGLMAAMLEQSGYSDDAEKFREKFREHEQDLEQERLETPTAEAIRHVLRHGSVGKQSRRRLREALRFEDSAGNE